MSQLAMAFMGCALATLILVVRVGSLARAEDNLSIPLFIESGEMESLEEMEGSEEADQLVAEVARGLRRPVREGRVDLVAKLLKALVGSPKTLPRILNWQDDVGATALHWCAFFGSEAHVALAKAFLQLPGVDGSILDKHNNSACHTACMRGHVGVLSALAGRKHANGCNPLALNSEGMSCLHYAARRGDAPALALLLEPNLTAAEVDAEAAAGATPLYLAVTAGAPAAVRALLAAGASTGQGRRGGGGEEERGESALALARRQFTVYAAILREFGEEPPETAPPGGAAAPPEGEAGALEL